LRRVLLVAVAFAACRTVAPARVTFDPALPEPPGVNADWLDLSVHPCDDFYRFACGGWMARHEIPPDRARWSQFEIIRSRNLQILHEVLEATAAGRPPAGTPHAEKLRDFYSTCMDEAGLERSLPLLKEELAALDRVKDARTLSAAVVSIQALGAGWPFELGAVQDSRDATRVIAQVDQGGIGLPERDYYLSGSERMKSIRTSYLDYLKTLFRLLGDAEAVAAGKAEAVMALETRLATASLPIVDRRDPNKVYHPVDGEGLEKAAPSFDWAALFSALQLDGSRTINVTHPPFLEGLEAAIREVPMDAWRAYLALALVRTAIPALPAAFQQADFQFTSKAITGAPADVPRWRKCVQHTDRYLGEALAVPFVDRTFGPEGKATTQRMVREIEAAFEESLRTLRWMDEPTRQRAMEKLHRITNKIGYPDRWQPYDDLKTTPAGFLQNWKAAREFSFRQELSRIGRPLDRARWLMTPPTVNAYYHAPMNEIVFPAGILQPPFFDRHATDAVNFGAMGMVVGHEVTHGFDDEGRLYDPDGNLSSWWTEASDAAFRQRARCLEDQYSAETVIDELKGNGALTLGENVADLGGVRLAYAAMKRAGAAAPPGQRFTPEQQFFIGFAHGWCSKTRPENVRHRVKTDPHSPPAHRVNVPLRNFPPFASAFGCQEGDRMAVRSAGRCEVW
jgi:endothelin-converting enzyme/putative endopeptidase